MLKYFIDSKNQFQKYLSNESLIDFQNKKNGSKIFLIFGQSNAANYSSKLFSTKKEVFYLYKKNIYKAYDPIMGASGTKGSQWIPMSESLINSGYCERILLVNIAEGSTSVFDWSSKGKFNDKIKLTLNELEIMKLKPDLIFWQQGEEDNLLLTSKEKYIISFTQILELLRGHNISCPVFLSITSYSPTAKNPINESIRSAQKEIIKENKKVFQGPDTDLFIGEEYRYDGIHFSENGAITIAESWKRSILKYNFNK